MKKNNKGFTLIELLAVIVVLAIIMVIASSNLMGAKKDANVKEAEKMEQMIEDLGPSIYADEKISGGTIMEYSNMIDGETKQITLNQLKDSYYLKGDIKNPSGNGNCEAYLLVKKTSDGPVFEGHICCLNLYKTDGPDLTDCSGY